MRRDCLNTRTLNIYKKTIESRNVYYYWYSISVALCSWVQSNCLPLISLGFNIFVHTATLKGSFCSPPRIYCLSVCQDKHIDLEVHSPTTVAQLVETLRDKPEGRGFDFRWCRSFLPHYSLGFYWASNRNEYQEYFLRGKGGLCRGLTTLPLSCADCL
jgi:hypothetical protein